MKKAVFNSAPKSEFRNDRMKWLELPEWHGMIPKHLPKSQFQEIMNSWRYRLLHYTNTAMTLSENSFLVHLMSALFSFFYWKGRGIRLVMQKTPSPSLRCELGSRVYNLGSKSENYRFTWLYSSVSEFVESSSNMERVAWLNIWTKVMVLRINQAGMEHLEFRLEGWINTKSRRLLELLYDKKYNCDTYLHVCSIEVFFYASNYSFKLILVQSYVHRTLSSFYVRF